MSGAIAPVARELRVPAREHRLQLAGIVPALGQAHGLAESGVTRYWYHEMSQAT
jgi:hypothetical protein